MQGEGSLHDFQIGLLDGSGNLAFSDYEGMVRKTLMSLVGLLDGSGTLSFADYEGMVVNLLGHGRFSDPYFKVL